jgi:uncharacterized repeat protein (TIGR01451 family)
MKKNKLKKTLYLLLVSVIILLQLIPAGSIVNAADSSNIKISGYTVSKANIYANDNFNMAITLENISASAITDALIIISSDSSFTPLGTGSIISVGNIAAGGKKQTAESAYNYDGGSNKLQVTIKYKIGSDSYEQSDFVTISQAVKKDTTPTTPVDTTKYAPKITIADNSSVPAGNAGSKMTYTLPLKNSGLYGARNIVVSPVLDDSVPFVIESMNISQTIDYLQPNEIKNVKFEFSISSAAQVKNYQIKFNIQCYNYSNDYFSSTVTGYLKIEEGIKLPKLSLKSISTNPSPVLAGEKFKLNISLENKGTVSAKDVSVTLLGLKNDGASIIGSSNKKSVSSIYGTADITFDLAASPKIEVGANSLKIRLDYKDFTGTAFSDEIEFFYNVQDSASTSNIELKNIISPGNALIPGDNAVIAFDIANTGMADAKNVKISISSDKEIIPRTLNTVVIPVLKKDAVKNVQFQLFVSDEAVTKNYPVAINIEYDAVTGGTSSKQSEMQYVGVYVENNTGKSVPRLIIDQYSIKPGELKAGQQFELNLSILNTSKSSTINNIKVTLSSDDGTFSAVDSNSFYIDSIPPKSKVAKKVVFSSKPDAPAKQYAISVNYEYEDEKGTALTSKDSIGIPIQQTPKFVIGELNIPSEAYIGSPIPINLSFYNMGKSTLYNLMVKLEGDFKVEGSSYFVGNFESGKTDSFDGSVIPEKTGAIKGNVIFTYEDADGKTQEIKKEISLNVTEMPAQDENPGEQLPPADEGFKIPVWGYIAGGVVIAALIAVIILVVRKKIKKRREFMFDEEL